MILHFGNLTLSACTMCVDAMVCTQFGFWSAQVEWANVVWRAYRSNDVDVLTTIRVGPFMLSRLRMTSALEAQVDAWLDN